MKPTYDELVSALDEVATQADEDCPREYRTKHFRSALEMAVKLVERAQA